MSPQKVAQLYDEHAEGIFRFLISLIGNPDDARDLLQDLFVKIARKTDAFDEITDKKSFLFRMARNAVIDRSRRLGARQRLTKSIKDHTSLFSPHHDPDREAFRDFVAQALDTLPTDQRTVVYLKLWEELTFERIAEVCDISPNTAASRYRYGLQKLRSLLNPVYQEITP